MKKEFVISISALLLTVAPVYAVNNHASNSQTAENRGAITSQEHKPLKSNLDDDDTISEVTVTPAPTITLTPTPSAVQDEENELPNTKDVEGDQTPQCNPSASWKNHGAYVSCVAHLRVGGKAVSEAAQSRVGKKDHASPSATPTIVPTETPTGTPTATPSPISSQAAELKTAFKPWQILQEAISQLLANLPFIHNRNT